MSTNKLCSMKEAISASVKNGSSLIIDGFTHLICFAAGHEIIRQGIKDLTAIRLTPDLVYDQLIEAGCVKKLVFSWAGNPGVGSLHALRRLPRTPQLFLLDDGFSHLALHRDLDLVAFPAADPFGGGRLPPSGRLREPLAAITRAHAVLLTGATSSEDGRLLAEALRRHGFHGGWYERPRESKKRYKERRW